MGFAGAKRKEVSFPSPAACATTPCKRSSRAAATAAAAAVMEWRDWASLLPDLMELITARVLAGDLVDYMSLRAVCTRWRASAPSLRDTTLRDERFRPRNWVALCDGDAVRLADACKVDFFQIATGRCIRVHLPELQGHRIIGFTDGILILLNKETTAVRVLHPFTRVTVDLLRIAAIFNNMVKDLQSRAWMRVALCRSQISLDSIAVVAWFPNVPGVVVAEPAFPCWYILYQDVQLAAAAPFQGHIYGVISNRRQIVQVYPQSQDPCIAVVPNQFGIPQTQSFFLVESAERLLLVLYHLYYHENNTEGHGPCRFALFEVNTVGHRGLAPLTNLGDLALFLSSYRCLSVSRRNLPSISGNSIYFDSGNVTPVNLYSVGSGTFEQIPSLSIIHDFEKRIRPSVRPFTLADHLFTFCSHRHWSRGLMFHEYHTIPRSWKLFKKLKEQDREVQIKTVGGSSSRSNGIPVMKPLWNK